MQSIKNEMSKTIRGLRSIKRDFELLLKKINLFSAVLSLCCCAGFSLVVASWGYSSCGVRASTAVASRCRAQALGAPLP